MMHDPWFIFCGALKEQAEFVTCPRRVLGKTYVGGRFGFGIFAGIQRKKPFWIIQMDSKALLT